MPDDFYIPTNDEIFADPTAPADNGGGDWVDTTTSLLDSFTPYFTSIWGTFFDTPEDPAAGQPAPPPAQSQGTDYTWIIVTVIVLSVIGLGIWAIKRAKKV